MFFYFTWLGRSAVFFLAALLTGFHHHANEPPYKITGLGKDGGWLWFNNESILIDSSRLCIGLEDPKGNARARLFMIRDLQVKELISDFQLSGWPERPQKYPYHNYPSLLRLGNDDLLAVYHKGAKDMFYRVAKTKDEKEKPGYPAWGEEMTVKTNNGINYNNLIRLSEKPDRVYNFLSIYNGRPSVMVSEDAGRSWSSDSAFMTGGSGGATPYSKFADNGRDRIDMIYTDGHPRKEPGNNIYHMYFHKGNFYRSDGAFISTLSEAKKKPLLPEAGARIYDGANEKPGWVWDIEYDGFSNPVAAFISSADGATGNDLRYHYAKWDAGKKQWIEKQVAFAGSRLYVPENHFAGGICIDPRNVNVVYISSNVNPETGSEATSRRYQLYRGVTSDNGESWKWEQLTFDTDKDNLRPIVPRGHVYNICVVWQALHDNAGSTQFTSEILGIFQK